MLVWLIVVHLKLIYKVSKGVIKRVRFSFFVTLSNSKGKYDF